MKGCLIILAIVAVLATIGIAASASLLDVSPNNGKALPTIQASTDAAKTLDQKFDDVEKAVKEAKTSSKPVPISLRITEQELTSKVAESMEQSSASSDFKPRNVQIHLVPGQMITTTLLNIQGIDINATITANISVSKSQPTVTIQSVQLGAIPVPGNLSDKLNTELQRGLSQTWNTKSIEVQEVQIQQGVMIITGVAKP